MKEHPKIQELTDRVLAYNQMLRSLNIRDHQVEKCSWNQWELFVSWFMNIFGLVFLVLATPGLILHLPVGWFCHQYSKKKAGGITIRMIYIFVVYLKFINLFKY